MRSPAVPEKMKTPTSLMAVPRTRWKRLRGSLRGEELKIAFFQNKLEVYENLVDLCLQRDRRIGGSIRLHRTGEIAQPDGRSASQPMHVPAESDAGQSDLVRSIRNLREELNWYYNLIEREQLRPEERSPERIQKLEQEARSREDRPGAGVTGSDCSRGHEAGLQMPSAVSLGPNSLPTARRHHLVEYFRIQDRDVACVFTRDELCRFVR